MPVLRTSAIGRRAARAVGVALVAALGLALELAGPPATHANDAAEPDIKAAMVFNIARFTQWPAAALGPADQPFTLCVLGRDEVTVALQALEDKPLHGRPIRVTPLVREGAIGDCRMLFVSRSETFRLNQIVSLLATSNRPVLSIADIPGFALKSGMVNLVKVDEKMRFEINQKEVEARGLTMSARLLQLALIVRTKNE